MTTAVECIKLAVKSSNQADELRTPAKSRMGIVHLEDNTLVRVRLEPGWSWEECIRPVAGTDTCQAAHLGYALSGAVTVRMADGTKVSIVGGDFYSIPPGHEAWVEGNVPFEAVEVMSVGGHELH